jgi:hypothetical protein
MNQSQFTLKTRNRDVPSSDFLDDLKRVAALLQTSTLTGKQYAEFGKYHQGTVSTRFGGWNKALVAAGLGASLEMSIDDESLFDNLRDVWVKLGRQPGRREMKKGVSLYSEQPYIRRFGSWNQALLSFVDYVNQDVPNFSDDSAEDIDQRAEVGASTAKFPQRRTNRAISDRLRFSILLRDGFRCHSCGRSPISSPGTELHVDHIVPWSKGGETNPENLQAKCLQCNLGKGNAFEA